MELNNSKNAIEKKPTLDNKNKFQALLSGGAQKLVTPEKRKDSQEKSDIVPSSPKVISNKKATYLNSLLKKSFFNTINKGNENSSINIQQSYNMLGDENSNSKLYYPKKVPKNFLPPYLFDDINTNKNKKLTRQTKNELRDVLDLYDKQKSNMKKYENDLKGAKEDLKKAKEARRKIMEEVYEIKKQIEIFNNNENNMNNNPLNRSRLSYQINNITDFFKNLNNGNTAPNNLEYEKKKNELDNEIKEYEDKISQLKFKNKSFVEDYDMLLNDYKKNLNKNLKLKNSIYDIDNKTKEALKEKAELKKYIDKMGKI